MVSSYLLKSWIFCRKLSGSTPLYWKGRNTPVTGSGALMSCLMYLHKIKTKQINVKHKSLHSYAFRSPLKLKLSLNDLHIDSLSLQIDFPLQTITPHKDWKNALYVLWSIFGLLFSLIPYLSFWASSSSCQLLMVSVVPLLLPVFSNVLLSRSCSSANSLENSRNAEHLLLLHLLDLFHSFIWID